MTTNQYRYGRKKEQKVAQALRNKGARVSVSPGSRGAADLVAKFPSGTRWDVQVKSTRSGVAASLSSKQAARLKTVAAHRRSTSVVAKVGPRQIVYESARSGRTLNPPTIRKR